MMMGTAWEMTKNKWESYSNKYYPKHCATHTGAVQFNEDQNNRKSSTLMIDCETQAVGTVKGALQISMLVSGHGICYMFAEGAH